MRLPVHRALADVCAERSSALVKFARQRLRRRLQSKSREIARRVLAGIESILIFDNAKRCVLHALPFRAFPRNKANTELLVRQCARPIARIRASRAPGGNAGKQEVTGPILMIFAA